MSMETTCPSCGQTEHAAAGEPVSCGACGQWYVPADSESGAYGRRGPHELEIQNAPGDAVRGPFDRVDLRERLYLGRLTGEELVRPVGGRFATLQSHPDFARILAIKERGRPKPVMARRAAPKRQAAAPLSPATTSEASASEAVPSDPIITVAEAGVARIDPRRAALIAVGTFVIGSLVLGFAYVAVSISL